MNYILTEEAIHNHTKKWQSVLKKPCTFTFFVLITGKLTKKETDFEQEKMATVAEDSVIKVAALSGSLRKASYNEGLIIRAGTFFSYTHAR